MSGEPSSIVCGGYLTKSPTSGGRGRWRLRWVELLQSLSEANQLRLEYYSSEKKKKSPIGVVQLESCVGIRELTGGNNRRYTSAFSLLFSHRSDLIFCSPSQKNTHQWMKSFKKCGIPILVSISGVNTLTRSVSESDISKNGLSGDSKQELERTTRRLPASPPLIYRHPPEKPSTQWTSSNPYAVVSDDPCDSEEAWSETIEGHYYSRAKFGGFDVPPLILDVASNLMDQMSHPHNKRFSEPFNRISHLQKAKLIVEPAPNLVALKSQLEGSKEIQVLPYDKLMISSYLADGRFGPIFTGSVDGSAVAIKELKSPSTDDEEIAFFREAFIISQFNHPNVVKLIAVTLTKRKTMGLELLLKQSLKDQLVLRYQRGELNEMELLKYCQDVALGMKHVHAMGYIHKYIKAKHVLVSSVSGNCKIAGFNEFAQTRGFDSSSEEALDPESDEMWMALEVLRKRQYSYQSDFWSYGVLLYEIWSIGRLPYATFTSKKLFEFLSSFQCFSPPPGCPRAIYQIMLQCWDHKPSNRPTWSSILDVLQRPDVDRLLQVDEKAVKLPPESLKLGSSNLSSAKNLHKDLQIKYSELQKQRLIDARKAVKENSKPHTISGRKRDSLLRRYCDFSTLRELFSRQHSQPASTNQESVHILSESKKATHKRRSKSADFDALMESSDFEEGSALFDDILEPYETIGFDDDSYPSITSNDSNTALIEAGHPQMKTALGDTHLAATPNTSIDLGMLSRSIQDLESVYDTLPLKSPPMSLPSVGITPAKSHGMKLSRSCESLSSVYETVDHNSLNVVPKQRVDKRRLRATTSHSAVEDRRLLSPRSSLVPHLVRQYEALSPSVSYKDIRNLKALSFAGENSNGETDDVPQQKSMKASSLDYNDSVVGLVSPSAIKKPRPFSADASNEEANSIYESACTYEAISGYESVPLQGTLASFLPGNSTVATSQ